MRKTRSAILEELERSPGDWTIRIEAIEAALRDGDNDGARQLVREDPSLDPLPPEIQLRLHTLMTKGVSEDPVHEDPVHEDPVHEQPEPEPADAFAGEIV